MNNLEFKERCKLSQEMLPKAPYRESLIILQNQMLEYIEKLEGKYKNGLVAGFVELYGISEDEAKEDAEKELEHLRKQIR
jgi:VIT1/CCC1 family predicted Fe2+/Mn2+ transporter